mmetsp:Transcript_31596/g.35264  ORF Transcript_31596/g.35264 Transcript_31596/m.35264 type:complete len:278 (+) Transcript_31596:427-1260(+)
MNSTDNQNRNTTAENNNGHHDDDDDDDEGFFVSNKNTVPFNMVEQQPYKHIRKEVLPTDDTVGMTEESTIEDTGTITVDSCPIGDNAVDDSTIVETTTTELKSKLNPDVNKKGTTTTTTTTTTQTVAPSMLLDDDLVVEGTIVSSWEGIHGVSESVQNTFSSNNDSATSMGNVVVIDLSEEDENNEEGIQSKGLVPVENEIDQNNNDNDKNGNSSEGRIFNEEERSTRENIIDILDENDTDGDTEQVRDIDNNNKDDDDIDDELDDDNKDEDAAEAI